MKKTASWTPFAPFNAKTSSAETPFLARAKGRPETQVVFNGHGQLLDAATRRLLDWTPEQVCEGKPAADSAAADDPPNVG